MRHLGLIGTADHLDDIHDLDEALGLLNSQRILRVGMKLDVVVREGTATHLLVESRRNDHENGIVVGAYIDRRHHMVGADDSHVPRVEDEGQHIIQEAHLATQTDNNDHVLRDKITSLYRHAGYVTQHDQLTLIDIGDYLLPFFHFRQ